MNFLTMKEELKKLYQRLNKEKEMLVQLFNDLPVGIVFLTRDGERFQNRAYEELSKKASVRESTIELDIGRVRCKYPKAFQRKSLLCLKI